MVKSGPSPAAGGDAGGLEVLLVVVEGPEVLVDLLGDAAGGFAVTAEDGEVELVVFEAADGEGEVHLEGTDGRVDLVGDGGVGGVGHAEFFDLGEDAVALVDVAGVELEVLLVGFIRVLKWIGDLPWKALIALAIGLAVIFGGATIELPILS